MDSDDPDDQPLPSTTDSSQRKPREDIQLPGNSLVLIASAQKPGTGGYFSPPQDADMPSGCRSLRLLRLSEDVVVPAEGSVTLAKPHYYHAGDGLSQTLTAVPKKCWGRMQGSLDFEAHELILYRFKVAEHGLRRGPAACVDDRIQRLWPELSVENVEKGRLADQIKYIS